MRWIVLGFLFMLSVMNYTDKSVLGLAAEPIMSELNLTYDQFGLVGSSFFAAYAIGSIILGTLTYKFNSKYSSSIFLSVFCEPLFFKTPFKFRKEFSFFRSCSFPYLLSSKTYNSFWILSSESWIRFQKDSICCCVLNFAFIFLFYLLQK
mgnify:CR=1 FL=1